MQKETEERVKAYAVRPTPVAGLSLAVTTRSFAFDLTFTVRETITDMQGRVIAKQGDQVNPLDRVTVLVRQRWRCWPVRVFRYGR